MLKFKVKKSESGRRADIVVSEHLPTYSRSSLKQLFSKGFVSIVGIPIKASHKFTEGELTKVDTALLETQPANINIPIIYEDDDVIVMNKPAGVLTHSKGALNIESSVASFIRPMITDESMNDNRAGIVHRLDRATSGVIIAAKNIKSLKWLQKQFSTRKVKKIYLAIVEGVPSPAEAIIDAPIERNPKKPQTFRVGGGGRPAETRYKVLKILNAFDSAKLHSALTMSERSEDRGVELVNKSSNSYSLLELSPRTGRTHQLRVHLKYIGHPIVGDMVYGHGRSPTNPPKADQAGKHMYLHAKSLEITMPGGKTKVFSAPEPKIFKSFEK